MVLKVWSQDQQHQQHTGTCLKAASGASPKATELGVHSGEEKYSAVEQALQVILIHVPVLKLAWVKSICLVVSKTKLPDLSPDLFSQFLPATLIKINLRNILLHIRI